MPKLAHLKLKSLFAKILGLHWYICTMYNGGELAKIGIPGCLGEWERWERRACVRVRGTVMAQVLPEQRSYSGR